MKPSLARPKNKRTSARNAALLNLAAWPGLGSVIAGRRIAGALQMAVFLVGFVLFCAWALQNISHYYQMMSFDAPQTEAVADKRLAIAGLGLCAAAWLWSMVTSISLSQAAADVRVGELKFFSASLAPLDEAKKNSARTSVPQWTQNGEIISRTFEFADFAGAMKFVNTVAELAEQAQHHPDVDIRWNKVTLALTTHDAGGLTEKDFALARACDEQGRTQNEG
jgi:4a-hydroxytetrahydrobiopterin dehydratase